MQVAGLDLMLESTAPVTDLQVTVTEVRPGETQEEYVTSGFLRSSDRTLSAASTALDPVPTYLAADRRTSRAGASPSSGCRSTPLRTRSGPAPACAS